MAQKADGFEETDEWLGPSNGLSGPLPQALLSHDSRIACLRLIRTDGIGPVTFRELINRFGGADAAIEALPELAQKAGRRRPLAVPSRAQAERELERARDLGVSLLFTIEPGYPPLLAHIPPAPPPVVYVRGQSAILDRPCIAIVGSRNSSAAGQHLARRFASDLGQAGYVIVSGLARGIDRAAHEASLETGTVAVMAGGLATIYPPEHKDLAARIAETGCLLSESHPDFEPRAQDFPRRNRLVSGMARGVVIVEAALRSGTLSTARFALEQGRDVFAVPGHPLDPRAEGVNNLIKQGATFTTSAADILAELGTYEQPLTVFREPRSPPLTPPELSDRREINPVASTPTNVGSTGANAVVAALGPHPTTIDDLVRATGLSVKDVNIALTELALDDRIIRHGQGLVSRREGRQE